MKILNIDIETRPATAYIWDLKTRYVPPGNIIEPKRMLCFAAKWVGQPRVYFFSSWHDGQAKMTRRVHELLDEADAALHYNGKRFDIPVINTEIKLAGLWPPSPFKQIDLYRVMTSQFAFLSYKLDEVSKALGTSRKVEHEGMQLWIKVLAGDPDARKRMRIYNIGDIFANEDLYNDVLPWIQQHPSVALHDGGLCPQCGSTNVERRGFAYTQAGVFQRFVCRACGKWSREASRIGTTRLREVA